MISDFLNNDMSSYGLKFDFIDVRIEWLSGVIPFPEFEYDSRLADYGLESYSLPKVLFTKVIYLALPLVPIVAIFGILKLTSFLLPFKFIKSATSVFSNLAFFNFSI